MSFLKIMSSSDSEDDCYGNAAQQLQKLKNKYQSDKLVGTNLLDDSIEIDDILDETNSKPKSNIETSQANNSPLDDSQDSDEIYINNLIANNSRRTGPRTRSNSKAVTLQNEAPTRSSTPKRGSSRGRRGRRAAPSGRACASEENSSNTSLNRSRGRRSRCSTRGSRSSGRRLNSAWPIYSVGNTDDYPDQSDNQTLFSNKPSSKEEVVVLDEIDPLDENEELSVKVCWQNIEYFKFTIRKYQKLTQIFDFFAKKENVSHDKLLFMYNDKILKVDDTPDSIDYNFVKFIDGGTVSQSVTRLVTRNDTNSNDGIKLKFQCQSVKKPFETTVQPDDKMIVSMMKCAEHLEKPLNKLRFEFDGDSISGKSTARELELEGGECIDVKFLS